jgi:hypothetical protein
MSDEFVPLADAVRSLRAELIEAAEAGADQLIRFGVGPIDLEFQVVAKREGGPNGKVKFGLLGMGFELGGNAKFSSEQVQKVKVSLKPIQVNTDGSITELEIAKAPTSASKSENEINLSRKPRS